MQRMLESCLISVVFYSGVQTGCVNIYMAGILPFGDIKVPDMHSGQPHICAIRMLSLRNAQLTRPRRQNFLII
jgi:hypothetical protein